MHNTAKLFETTRERTELEFTVYGTPEPQGSTQAFMPKGWGANNPDPKKRRPIITSDNPDLKKWRKAVADNARGAVFNAEGSRVEFPIKKNRGVHVAVTFYFAMTQEGIRKCAREGIWKLTKPDTDKLLRAILDALEGVVYEHDAQVCSSTQQKCYTTALERAEITVYTVRGETLCEGV